jgi:hypothetical protein
VTYDPNLEWRERQRRQRINEQIARDNYESAVNELARFLMDYRNGAHSWADDPYKAAEGLIDRLRMNTITLYCPCGRRMSGPQCGTCDRDPDRE